MSFPNTGGITRHIAPDGSVVISDARCSIIFRRFRPGALEIRIAGADSGQFGTAMIDEVAMALMREGSLELFVDTSEVTMPPASVNKGWGQFFALNRGNLKRVRILAESQPVALAIRIVQHLSNTGDLLQIYSERELYDARKAQQATSS